MTVFLSKLMKLDFWFLPLSVVGYLFCLLGTFVCASCLLLVVECWFSSADYWLLDEGFGVCCLILVSGVGCWVTDVGCWLLIVCVGCCSVFKSSFPSSLYSAYDNCHSILYVMYVILLMFSEEKSVIQCILSARKHHSAHTQWNHNVIVTPV